MHGHEKKILKEVLSSGRSIHMVYKGARVGSILMKIIKEIKEPLVVIGVNSSYVEAVRKTGKETGIQVRTIDAKTALERRRKIYREIGCIFVSEQIFLTDVLKEFVGDGVRVVYLAGGSVYPSKTMMEFILFAFKGKINIIYTWDPLYSFSEMVSNGYFSSSEIFLYPSFRKSVISSLGNFEITEITVGGGKERELIQMNIMELIKKIDSTIGKSLFDQYIESAKKSLQVCLVLLYNVSAEIFAEIFGITTDIDRNMATLSNLYGVADSMHARNTVYKNTIGWMASSEVEEIKEAAGILIQKEKISPKESVIIDLLKKDVYKNRCILSSKIPLNFFNQSDLKIKSGKSFQKEIRKIAKEQNPQVILINYTTELLRRIKLCRERWRKRGVEVSLTVIRVKGSAEEINLLEEMAEEKDQFISAIGIKQNRPEVIERKTFIREPADPKAPLLEIDVRELRSKLPMQLAKHFTNLFKFDFRTLTTGDYVLNRTYFIERKRIDDFVSSLSSGRLLKQMQSLDFFKRSPYLLIEFPEKSKISFLSYTARITEMDLIPKIVKLLLSLRNIFIFYSSNERHSSALVNFLGRKAPGEINTKKESYSPKIIETLLAIPGIDYENVENILNKFESLYDLITSDEKRLRNSLGERIGENVHRFFNTKQ